MHWQAQAQAQGQGQGVTVTEGEARRPGALAAAKGISYRPEAEEDLPFLDTLYASTRAEEVAVTGWPADVQRAFLADQFALQRRHYLAHYPEAEWLVVEHGGARVGRLYLERWSGEMRVIDIALIPESRGLGFGTAILGDLIAEAEGSGLAVSIHVERNNPAMRLYLRLGFRKAEEHGVYDLLRRGTASLSST